LLDLLEVAPDIARNALEVPKLLFLFEGSRDAFDLVLGHIPKLLVAPLKDKFILGINFGLLHEEINGFEGACSFALKFIRIFFESLFKDFILEQLAYASVCMLVLKM
jgi:hypothetical protein